MLRMIRIHAPLITVGHSLLHIQLSFFDAGRIGDQIRIHLCQEAYTFNGKINMLCHSFRRHYLLGSISIRQFRDILGVEFVLHHIRDGNGVLLLAQILRIVHKVLYNLLQLRDDRLLSLRERLVVHHFGIHQLIEGLKLLYIILQAFPVITIKLIIATDYPDRKIIRHRLQFLEALFQICLIPVINRLRYIIQFYICKCLKSSLCLPI